jgi:hypothetical protein
MAFRADWVADATLRRHYGRFMHADAADAFELSKIDSDSPESVQFAPPLPLRGAISRKHPLIYGGKLVEQKGFEPLRKPRTPWVFQPQMVPEVAVSVQFAPRGANPDVRPGIREWTPTRFRVACPSWYSKKVGENQARCVQGQVVDA